MSKGDTDERSNSVTEPVPTLPGSDQTVPAPNQTVPTLDEERISADENKSSANSDTNPDSQLFQRRSSHFKTNGKTKDDNNGEIFPAILDVGELQTVTLGHVNKLDVLKDENGGLGKGVVLNATQLYPSRDVRWAADTLGKDKAKDHELRQNYMISGNQVVELSTDKRELDQVPDEVKGDMSFLRKIVFGISFIPSVLFVLCFAVILPCKEPGLCTKELWSTSLNATGISTDFSLVDKQLFVSLAGPDELLSLHVGSGKEIWTSLSKNSIIQMECKNFDANGDGIADCLAMNTDGLLYAYNVADGKELHMYNFSGAEISNFVILSSGPHTYAVGVAISPSEIQIYFNENVTEPVLSECKTKISSCKTTPKMLTSWHHNNTDLIYICETDSGGETLQFMKYEDLCIFSQKEANILVLLNRNKGDLKDIVLKPTDDGLITWAEDVVTNFDNDGQELWRVSVTNHSDNRYLFYGHFFPKTQHIALISGDSTTYTQITLLDATGGNITFSHYFELTDVKNAVMLNGDDQDYILILLKEREGTEEHASFNEFPSATILPISDNPINVFKLPQSTVSKYRLTLLQLQMEDGRYVLQQKGVDQEILHEKTKGELWTQEETVRLSVISKDDILKIFMGRSIALHFGTETVIQALEVNEWSKSHDHYCK